MIKQQDKKEELLQALQDVGCDEKIINQFFQLLDEGQKEDIFLLIANYRSSLLNGLHQEQKKLDILDYLISNLKKAL